MNNSTTVYNHNAGPKVCGKKIVFYFIFKPEL